MKLQHILQLAAAALLGCPASLQASDVTLRVIGEAGQPVPHTLVYLKAPGLTAPQPADAYSLDQRGLAFVPRVLVVPPGATVRFVNSDAEMHNVNSGSPIRPFNFAMVRKGSTHEERFREVGFYPLLCDVHPHMRAWIAVLASPHYGVSDDAGRLRIANVPEGAYTLVIWREGKPVREEPLSVGGTPIEQDLAVAVAPAAATAIAPSRPADGWAGTVDRVRQKLAWALEQATARREGEASTGCYDAYFVHFEAEGMETAVRENVSARKAFEDEERFGEVRDRLLALAKGSGSDAEARAVIDALLAALAEDVAEIAAGEVPAAAGTPAVVKTGPAAKTATAEPQPDPAVLAQLGAAADAIRDIRLRFAESTAALTAGDRARAAERIGEAYFAGFHRFETGLAARHPNETAALERRFQTARSAILAGAVPDEAGAGLETLAADIESLVRRAEGSKDSPAIVFASSFLIVVREGFEALIVIAAILGLLARSGRKDLARAVHLGVASALAASLLTAWGLRTLLTAAPASQEAMEGVTMLLASAVLFYVSCWFLANSEVARWNRFVQGRVRASIGAGSLWSLGLVAFLAVYREGAETVLFYEALAASAGGWTVPVLGGLAVGSAALAAMYLVFRYASVRLPLKAMFAGTSSILYLMAFVMAGKGIAELQEAGWLGVTPVAHLPTLPLLGVYPTVQTALVQGLFLAAGVIGFGIVKARRPAPAPVAKREPVGAGR